MNKVSNEPLISVIVPFYNVEEYLGKCLSSILAQDYKNLEILLIDDGSTDSSSKIAVAYAKKDSRIRLIHSHSANISAARNIGISQARGEYISFVDADDYVAPNYISILYQLTQKYHTPLAITKHYIVYPNKTIDSSTGREEVLASHELLDKMLYDEDVDVSAWGKLYRKDLFKNIKYPTGKIFEDAATTCQIFQVAQAAAIKSTPTYYYIRRPGSITSQDFNPQMFDLIEATNQMTANIIKWYPDLAQGCARRKMFAHLSTLSQLTKVKHPAPEYLQPLMQYIKANRRTILADPRLPRRDRFALHATRFGFHAYRLAWKLYNHSRRSHD